MNRIFLPGLAALLLSAGGALALSTQDLIDSYTAEGFTRIEVKTGPTQTKVEALRGTEKVEVIYDTASGAVLKRETETVAAGAPPGIEIDTRDRDFLRGGGRGADVSDDDDGDDDHGRGRGRGRGGDDDRADDDDGDDDHGGRGRGRGRGGDDD